MAAPRFQVFFWPQRLLVLGPAFDADTHRHHAAQIAVGLYDELRVRGSDNAPWRRTAGYFVPPDCPHGFDSGNTPCALWYWYADGGESELACARFGWTGIKLLAANTLPLAALRHLAEHDCNPADAERINANLLGTRLVSGRAGRFDPRIQAALDWVNNHLGEPIRLKALATTTGTSQSWLSHQFRRQVGVPLRRYVLWSRLRYAMQAAFEGMSLTGAAHAAGFSDSAHLTRTFREAYGIKPSFLFGDSAPIRVQFVGDT